MKPKKLILVYNANSGLFSQAADFAHKIVSPSTYRCHLCAITYGDFSMKQDWKVFISDFPVEMVFLYKDEFLDQYKVDTAFPAVFMLTHTGIRQLISQQEIENCRSIEELKLLIVQKYQDHVQRCHTDI
jgi:hypothetical protein